MTLQPHIPNPETSKRLLENLRRTRLELAESNLELAEISALLENNPGSKLVCVDAEDPYLVH